MRIKKSRFSDWTIRLCDIYPFVSIYVCAHMLFYILRAAMCALLFCKCQLMRARARYNSTAALNHSFSPRQRLIRNQDVVFFLSLSHFLVRAFNLLLEIFWLQRAIVANPLTALSRRGVCILHKFSICSVYNLNNCFFLHLIDYKKKCI